ncbi:hypothetical protein X975_04177, partial [Stegodyphus mimosarum]
LAFTVCSEWIRGERGFCSERPASGIFLKTVFQLYYLNKYIYLFLRERNGAFQSFCKSPLRSTAGNYG